MRIGRIGASTNSAWKVLRSVLLDDYRVELPRYESGMLAAIDGLSYLETWKLISAKQWFNFRLQDQALIQIRKFDCSPLKVTYCYYPCALDICRYREFAKSGLSVKDSMYGSLREQYELHMVNAPLRNSLFPIRYDVDHDAYRAGCHPAAHLHLGCDNDVRIATRRYWSPLTFMLFVLRQCYPIEWMRLLDQRRPQSFVGDIRDRLEMLATDYWTDRDELEAYLS